MIWIKLKLSGMVKKSKFVAIPLKSSQYDSEDIQDSEETVFDLSDLNLNQFIQNTKQTFAKKPSRLIVLRNRENRKIGIEIDRLLQLTKLIEETRSLARGFMELKADQVFQNDLLAMLVENRVKEYEALLKNRIKQINNAIIRDSMDIEREKMSLSREKAEIDSIKLNNELLKAITKDIPTWPAKYRAYAFAQRFGQSPDSSMRNFEMEEKIVKYLNKKYSVEMNLIDLEGIIKKAKVKTEVAKLDREFRDYKDDDDLPV